VTHECHPTVATARAGHGQAFAEQIWGDLGRWELADLAADADMAVCYETRRTP